MNITLSMPIVWLVLLIGFCIAEGMTAGLVSIWFALGAAAALIAALIGAGPVIQVIAFAAVSLLAMILIRPLAAKIFRTGAEATNADRVIGQEAIVIVPIDGINGTGQVKAGGAVWTARTDGPDIVPEGTRVIVRRIEGVKVIVEPLAGGTARNTPA